MEAWEQRHGGILPTSPPVPAHLGYPTVCCSNASVLRWPFCAGPASHMARRQGVPNFQSLMPASSHLPTQRPAPAPFVSWCAVACLAKPTSSYPAPLHPDGRDASGTCA